MKPRLLDLESLHAAAECLRVLAHPHRLQIVQLLLDDGPRSVGDIAATCGLTQPATSDHLRLMKRCGFLSHRRDGKSVYYSVAEPHLRSILECMQSRFG